FAAGRANAGMVCRSGAADACASVPKAMDAHLKSERMKVRMLTSGQNSGETEAMIVPEGMYIKLNEQWIKSPIASSREEIMKFADPGKVTLTDCKAVGREAVDGAATAVYTYKGKVEGQKESEGKIWIGNEDGLPHKAEVKSGSTLITQFISHGAEIQAPKGGLELPAGIGNLIKGFMK
ncbi:MAG: hypothetical protein ACR2FI_06135, partial [Burkholderiales bacterium]